MTLPGTGSLMDVAGISALAAGSSIPRAGISPRDAAEPMAGIGISATGPDWLVGYDISAPAAGSGIPCFDMSPPAGSPVESFFFDI
jgi:hypothetical protein